MQFQGTVNIKAQRDAVWAFLIDADRVGSCMPGVESVEVVAPGQKFKATMAVGFGVVKAKFNGDVEFVELDAPNRAKIKGHGSASGSAVDVMSEMSLSDGSDGSTDMRWMADVTVLGTLASLAARMMGGVTQNLSNQFFTCVKTKVEGGA